MRYNDLSQEAKEVAQGIHAERALDYGWWEFTYEEWVDKLEEKGINTETKYMNHSGFCFQGCGACFTGHIDLREFLEAHPDILKNHNELYLSSVPFNKVALAEYDINLVRISHAYSHEMTVGLDWELIDCDGWIELSAHLQDLMAYAEDDILGQCREYMKELYRDLDITQEYLRSEEALIEEADANDWEYTKSGKLK